MRQVPVAWIALLATAACAGAGLPNLRSTQTSPTSVAVTIRIPVAASAAQRNRPMYVASTTRSVSLLVTSQTTHTIVLSTTFNVTSSSAGCSTAISVTTCTESFVLAPDSYSATVSTYDAAGGTGNVLSEEQAVAFSVLQGVANSIPLTLYGVPTSVSVTGSADTVRGSQAGGFTVFGSQAQPFTITTKDADGNVIIGPGLPTWSVALSTGSGFTITQPSAGGTTFSLTASGNNTETFAMTGTFTDSSVCAQSGAVCSATFSAARQQLLVYCGVTTRVLAYSPPYTGAPATLGTVVCGADGDGWVDHDAQGDVFAMGNGKLEVIDPPYSSVTATVSVPTPGNANVSFAIEASNNTVFACSGTSAYEIPAPYASASVLSGITCPSNPAVAMSGSNMIISQEGGATFDDIAKPYTTVTATLSPGPNVGERQPFGVDAAGDLAAAYNGSAADNASVFLAPLPSTAVAVPGSNSGGTAGVENVQFDDAGNLFMLGLSGLITEHAPPFSGTLTNATSFLSTGIATGSTRFAVDANDNAFVGIASGGTALYEFSPPYPGTKKTIESTNSAVTMTLTP